MILRGWGCRINRQELFFKVSISVLLVNLSVNVHAQDVQKALGQANSDVRSYFPIAADLMYACGALVGLIGAVKVYQKWNSGDPDTGRTAAAWFGSCVFLVIVATVIRAFFGI